MLVATELARPIQNAGYCLSRIALARQVPDLIIFDIYRPMACLIELLQVEQHGHRTLAHDIIPPVDMPKPMLSSHSEPSRANGSYQFGSLARVLSTRRIDVLSCIGSQICAGIPQQARPLSE